jgi:thioredoxin-like negative regulator of GroEL
MDPISVLSSEAQETTLAEAKKLVERKKWTEAVVVYRALLKNEPNSLPVVGGLSTALTYTGHREEALNLLNQQTSNISESEKLSVVRRIKVLSKLFLTNETFRIYQEGLNLLLSMKYRNAKERFQKALAEEPDNVEILTRLGQSHMKEEENGIAVSRLSEAKKLNPYEPQVHLWYGRALHMAGKSAEALPELKSAASDLIGSETATVWVAECMYSLGQVNPSIKVLTNDAKTFPLHLQSLILGAKYKFQMTNSDRQVLWSARKDLQLAMSRIELAHSENHLKFEEDLSLDLRRSPEETKSEIQKLMLQVQNRLEEKVRK